MQLSNETLARLNRVTTVSDKIRLLDREGYARAEIARILDKRYQHVRNVLERDAATAADPAPAREVPGPDTVLRLTVAADGTLKLPPEVLRGLDLPQGGVLSGRLENGQLTLIEPLVALRRVQEALRPLSDRLRAEGRSIVDELIAERRAEAEGEGRR